MSDLDSESPATAGSAFDRLEALDQVAPTVGATPDTQVRQARKQAPARTAQTPAPKPDSALGVTPAPTLTRRGRLSRWDRPPPPKDWRWWVGNLGKTLITTGLLMFGFVAYQLWGTGIETARAQNKLENEFDALLAAAPIVDAPDFVAGGGTVTEPTATVRPDLSNQTDSTDQDTAAPASTDQSVEVTPVAAAPPVPVADQNIPSLENGDALARIEIPTIGVSDIVVAGVETRDLKKGPGHFPDTPLPGQLGNAAIAGHRTTYGQPFHNVDKLAVGDEIVVTTLSGRFIYAVTGQQIVAPSDYHVIATTDPGRATLTLTSCHPKWTAEQRIVIFSELIGEESAPVGEPVLNYGRPDEPVAVDEPALPGESTAAEAPTSDTANSESAQATSGAEQSGDGQTDTGQTGGSVTGNLGSSQSSEAASSDAEALGSEATNDGIADAFSEGWFSDPSANPHVAFWAMLLALIAIGGYYISRRFRSYWIGSMIGLLPFVVALYFFYQNVNRLLPPNL